MEVQRFVLKDAKAFEPNDIFDCGQCFRWNVQSDGSYTGVFKGNVLNVKKDANDIIFEGICNGDIKQVCNDYFDLDTDYDMIKEKLSNIDIHLKKSVEFGKGIRILRQDLWETIISFIISANNNIPRIKGIIDKMSRKYGGKITYNGEEYYSFPSVEELSKASVEELRGLGMGFRDKRIYDTTKLFADNSVSLAELESEQNTNVLRDKLMNLPGVGRKVADCVMLFSLHRFEVFPVDVWVRRVMNELYIQSEDEAKVSNGFLQELAKEKYGGLAGLAQQYLFYCRRNS